MKERINTYVSGLKYKTYAVYLAFRRGGIPWYAKAAAVFTIAYALSPIDLIPDFIPVLGYLDDLIILPLLLAVSVRLIPKNVMKVCMAEASDLWKDGKIKKWYYAVPVVFAWLIVLFVIVYSIAGRVKGN